MGYIFRKYETLSQVEKGKEVKRMELTTSIIQLSLILMIIGLLMASWQPPIRSQYRCILLLVVGGGLGFILDCGVLWGLIISGLVFYKDELVLEVKLVKESFDKIQNDKGEN